MENGFVPLPRFITTRKWYVDPIARAVFIDLLLSACWKDEVIKGVQLKRGQLVTSLAEIADRNGIKLSHARSILSRIQKSNDIASRSNPKFSVITLSCLDYESDDSKVESKQTASTPTSKEQSYIIIKNNKEVKKETISAQAREGCGAQTPDFESSFERFWSAYPKKKAKANALKVWLKLKPNEDLVIVILSALEQQKRSADWLKDNGQYIPYPATWLNGKRWEDGITEVNGSGRNAVNSSHTRSAEDWLKGFNG